jgi:hypothetical protein
MLWVFGADGLVARNEMFATNRDDEALARFDELAAGRAARIAPAPSRVAEKRGHRVRPNAATAWAARLSAAVAARDPDALPALWADELEIVDHTTGTVYGRQGEISSFRSLLRAQEPTHRQELLATLGDSLALSRVWQSASGFAGREFDVGAYEREVICVFEIDAQGRQRWSEVFAADRLGDAAARLYERYADLLPDGPARARAAATARSVAVTAGPIDLDRYAAAMAPAVETVDHRILGTWSARGAEALLEVVRSVFVVAIDPAIRLDEVLCLQPDARLVRQTHHGTDRASGGAYEQQFLALEVFGSDGLLTRVEEFDADRDAAALARFDELVLSPPDALPTAAATTVQIENAATRAFDGVNDVWEARDWARYEALYPPGFRYCDRRRMVQLELDREQYLEFTRALFEMSSRLEGTMLATRGDRLVLARSWVHVEGVDRGIGPSEIESLVLLETDERGGLVATVRFDANDFDAAYAELDRRFFAGEAVGFAHHARRVDFYRRADGVQYVEALAELLAPDFVVVDHSPLGWGTLDRPAYVESVKALAALAPDCRTRTDHQWLCERGSLGVHVVFGTHEGGAFEQPRVTVSEVDAEGRERRRDIYTLDQLDEARVRFEELRPDPLRIPPNAACRALDRVSEARIARDWPALRALAGDAFVYEDRRKRVLLTGGVELWMESVEFYGSARLQIAGELIATVGDRIALERCVLTGEPDGVAVEIELLLLREIDANGRLAAWIVFDLDDRRAAVAEAQARFVVGEAVATGGQAPIARLFRAYGQHDWVALRACLAHDLVFRDHRTLGLLGTLDRDQWVESLRAQTDLAPEVDAEHLHILCWNGRGRVDMARVFGTIREGGPFENVFVRVMVTNGNRIQRCDVFDVGAADQALARFAELCAHSA